MDGVLGTGLHGGFRLPPLLFPVIATTLGSREEMGCGISVVTPSTPGHSGPFHILWVDHAINGKKTASKHCGNSVQFYEVFCSNRVSYEEKQMLTNYVHEWTVPSLAVSVNAIFLLLKPGGPVTTSHPSQPRSHLLHRRCWKNNYSSTRVLSTLCKCTS